MYSSKETLTGRARPEQLVQTSLKGIAKKAKRLKKYRFRDLYRQINHSALSKAWDNINKKAAAGVDKITAKEFAKNLKDNIESILDSLIGKRYHAKMVRRVNIEKDNGKLRPLGIPVVADKIVQRATADILEAIYEQDFIDNSYGYRPNRDSKVAIKSLTKELQFGKYSYIVEADIKGFFDNIDHDWLIEMLKQRVNDKEFIRLIKKWLKAGILKEDGQVIHPVTGTPQGGIISPILANIYLHYVLDIWFIGKVKKECAGEAHLCRYADDFVCAFRYKRDAERFYHMLQKRLNKFGLALSLEKTNIISFSRFRKYENNSFEFLGFEMRWGTSRKGKDIIKRRTSRKKLRKSLKNFTKWCKENRNKRLRSLFSDLNAKLRG
ncbi:group II intron reverse transcriptase/maturase, partial [Candidatus Frackibacter sp. WG12]|uniref:group II intron reverse transcriptase/maturase n=2 Tax=unclassified Candidatus Frackibacter TaxID=2648818 RepID=UPI0008C7214F